MKRFIEHHINLFACLSVAALSWLAGLMLSLHKAVITKALYILDLEICPDCTALICLVICALSLVLTFIKAISIEINRTP